MSQLTPKRDNNVPEGAVKITKEEALIMQWDLINNWEPKSDVWFFRFGAGMIAASSTVSSTLIMQYYRKKMKLHTFGRPIMFIPGVILPCMALPFLHLKTVVEPILLQDHCPVCIQMRSASIQSTLSIFYPMIVHSAGSFLLANSFATYRLPEFSVTKPLELLSFWRKISKKLFGNLPMHLLLQFAVSIFITEMEAKELFKIQANMALQQQQSS